MSNIYAQFWTFTGNVYRRRPWATFVTFCRTYMQELLIRSRQVTPSGYLKGASDVPFTKSDRPPSLELQAPTNKSNMSILWYVVEPFQTRNCLMELLGGGSRPTRWMDFSNKCSCVLSLLSTFRAVTHATPSTCKVALVKVANASSSLLHLESTRYKSSTYAKWTTSFTVYASTSVRSHTGPRYGRVHLADLPMLTCVHEDVNRITHYSPEGTLLQNWYVSSSSRIKYVKISKKQ